MVLWWSALALAADPIPVVAVGDPLTPGGWVAVAADCLEERAEGRYEVTDRTGATLGADAILGLKPKLVILSVLPETGAKPEGKPPGDDPARPPSPLALQPPVAALLDALRARGPVLVVAPRPLAEAARQGRDGILVAPIDPPALATDQDQARVGAAVCDAVLAGAP